MKKFRCTKCAHRHTIRSEVQPIYCMFRIGASADWREVKEPAAATFPQKLTPAVFGLPECPEWARYAAVDQDGHAHWFGGVPNRGCKQNSEKWYHHETTMAQIPGRWDASDYTNSIVGAEDYVVPSWCVPGAWVRVNEGPCTGEIRQVYKTTVDSDDGSVWVTLATTFKHPVGGSHVIRLRAVSRVRCTAWNQFCCPLDLKVAYKGILATARLTPKGVDEQWGYKVEYRYSPDVVLSFEGLLKDAIQVPSGLPCGEYEIVDTKAEDKD